MHYEIRYDHLEGQAKVDKGVEDIRSYLDDDERFDAVCTATADLLRRESSIRQIRFAPSFAGIGGYPVEAITS